ncbi:MAG: hypothetical protein H6606_05345 [Flavobacteriales bacterium]|nr:hypothetical protein [Flavobacteriales bacterium]
MKTILKLKDLRSKWMRSLLLISVLAVFSASAHANPPTLGHADHLPGAVLSSDSGSFARVIVYRPDNQLRRKYKINTNHGGYCELRRKQMVEIHAGSSTFTIEVNASGHKKEQFSFELKQGAVHHLRIQDRNNYQGFVPFLEVIEVSEATYRRESPYKPD